jgi:hypothetical protein
MAISELKFIHTFHDPGNDDTIFAWATRTADTDVFAQWNGTGWTEIWDLPATGATYDAVTWLGKIFFCDGKTGIWAYDYNEGSICLITDAPVVQYLIVHQDRLVGGGDARNQAEVEADGGTWPVDSNRDRVLFCEVIDYETWSPNNFIDCRTGTGEVITGLGINSITTSDKGSQTQLAIFKRSTTLINQGTLGAADQTLNVVSAVLGCPAYKTIVNTPFGLMFKSLGSVCLLDTSGREPQQVGFVISPAIAATTDDDLQALACAIFHNDTYKLAITTDDDSTYNDAEWWLDMRPVVFPSEQNWYGPHSDDLISQYETFAGELIASQAPDATLGNANLWKLDVTDLYGSMTDSSTARSSIAVTGRVPVPGMTLDALDAIGFVGQMAESTDMAVAVDYDYGTATLSMTWTSPATLANSAVYSLLRVINGRPAHDVQVTFTHDANSDVELHSLYLRSRPKRRQPELQSGSTQA